jgi:hypothetical protein
MTLVVLVYIWSFFFFFAVGALFDVWGFAGAHWFFIVVADAEAVIRAAA